MTRTVTREWGPADGRPLVFWPGLNPWGGLQLVEVGPLLAGRGFRVVSIAPPGGGETPPLDDPDAYRPSRLAELVLEVADEQGFDHFAFMGASWGASIGVHLASVHAARVQGLILLDAGHTDVTLDLTRDELVAEFEAEQANFAFESWDGFFAYVRERVRSWRPELEPRYRAGMTERAGRVLPLASARAAAWALYGVAAEPPSSQLARLTVPVLLVLARDREDAEARARFEAAVPHGQVVVLDSGHDIPEDAPHELVDLLAGRRGDLT